MSVVKERYDVMNTFFKKRIAQFFILIGHDFVVIEKLPDPEVLNKNNDAEAQNFCDYVALKVFKSSYQKSVSPKMSAFERFISVENLITPMLLVFSKKSINT